MRKTRECTIRLLELVDEGALDKDSLIQDLLGWMSEDDVREFCERNLSELFEDEEDFISDEDAEAMMDDFNYVGNKSHY